MLTPSSYGLQPWKFFVVTDPAVKAQLPAHSWGQRQPQDCSHMVVFALRANLGEEDVDRYLARIGEVRGQTVESLAGFKRWPPRRAHPSAAVAGESSGIGVLVRTQLRPASLAA